MGSFYIYFCVVIIFGNGVSALTVSISNDGPAVRGSNVTFTATVAGYTDEELKFVFNDDATPEHKGEFVVSSNTFKWVVEYPRDLYEAGEYTVDVTLMKVFLTLWYPVSHANTALKLTDSLNGNLVLSQNNVERPNNFVAVNKTVTHSIKLPDKELEFLQKNSSSIITYWFIDCSYVDQTMDMSLNYTYNDVMSEHTVEAVVVANHEPLPPLTTTTTSTTTSTTTPSTTIPPKPTTVAPNVTTVQPMPNITISTSTEKTSSNETLPTMPIHKIVKRAVHKRTKFKKTNAVKDYICHNSSYFPIGKSFTYGHFQEIIDVRAPISTLNITGPNWLQHGDLLRLDVKYTGTPPFEYCAQYKSGEYNITGNETCSLKTKTESNMFPLVHYFSDSDQHTVVVIIENEVGKTMTRAVINIYKVAVHAQLSVIVVPVVFCLVAVILVAFGIAYYQHRARYTVEVADFDFGQAHLDYKTFRERLRDSFRSAFNFGPKSDTDPLTSSTRYDSMT